MKKQTHVIYSDHGRREVIRFLEALSLEKPVRVTVEDDRRKRTSNQNRLYWEWLDRASDETGYTPNELHEYCKERFCPPKVITICGEAREVKSTASLDTRQMTTYMDEVYRFFAGEVGILLPLPEAA